MKYGWHTEPTPAILVAGHEMISPKKDEPAVPAEER